MNERARYALRRADQATDPALRRLWVVAAIDAILGRTFVIVGGTAVDLYTGQYNPTDIDLVGSVSKSERAAIVAAGFLESGGRHIAWTASDGMTVLVEFPGTDLDSSFDLIELEHGVTVAVVSLTGLVIDRMIQATHPNSVSFDEAVALTVAVADDADWQEIAESVRSRTDATYLGLVETARRVLVAGGLDRIADRFFASP